MGWTDGREVQMQTNEDMPIVVRHEWNGWRTAEVRLGDLQDIHWLQPSGAPRALVHAYISCASITRGNIPHNCERSAGPHRLLVCLLKRHTSTSVYTEIVRRADEQRTLLPSARRPDNSEDWSGSLWSNLDALNAARVRGPPSPFDGRPHVVSESALGTCVYRCNVLYLR
jgi:hypothetical protein